MGSRVRKKTFNRIEGSIKSVLVRAFVLGVPSFWDIPPPHAANQFFSFLSLGPHFKEAMLAAVCNVPTSNLPIITVFIELALKIILFLHFLVSPTRMKAGILSSYTLMANIDLVPRTVPDVLPGLTHIC